MLDAFLLHGGEQVGWGDWSFEPTVVFNAIVILGFYIYLLRRFASPIDWQRVALFSSGALAIFLALVSPLDAGAGRLLSLHMLQHVILTSIGPPLVLLGLPSALLRPLFEPKLVNWLAQQLTSPLIAATLFIVNMWFWHVPAIYETALTHQLAHITMHVAFMSTGLLFWWPVIQPLPELSRIGEGARLLYLFVSGFPMALLALLLLSSGSVLYEFYEAPPHLWGISPLSDQQVAGIIMGALGEAASFIAITFLFFRFLDREGKEAAPSPGSAGPV